ncbi:MAG: polymer-forming cytoskeletal protein [Pseudomonadota bacterium]
MGRNKDESQLNGLLDRGCSFEGKLMFDGTVQINGDFRGEILSDGTLVVGAEAQVNAKVQVDTIIVEGTLQGLIEAKRKVELRRGCRVSANIVAPSLMIEEGSIFQGQCQMMEEPLPSGVAQTTAHKSSGIAEEGEDSLMM